jgi:thymidylate synthase
MKKYLQALEQVLEEGSERVDRTGVGTKAYFGMQTRYNMNEGFPAVTTKKLFFDAVKAELLWFIKGSRDIKELQKMGCYIWDENAKADYWKEKAEFEGDVGRIYGVQWREWRKPDGEFVDQLKNVIEGIKKNPYGRRHIVTAWNPGELETMALPPCHTFFQLFVAEEKLSLQMYQRSCDMFLGVPFNIASYSLFLHMIAQVTGYTPGDFIHVLGDAHIYKNHYKQVKEQLKRKPYPLPTLELNKEIKNIDDFKMEDISLKNYKHHPSIKAKMAV